MENVAIMPSITKGSNARDSKRKNVGLKDARIELKTTLDTKGALEQAAALCGVTLTSFIMGLAVEKAQTVLSSSNTVSLNQQAWATLDEAIAKPASAPQALRDLMLR
ncbi:DUF1778 domain-containing protein [Shewanella colwelliana]|uniref:type II toxin-antitoxin system TacA family antitoxin n=1 Tax=Shewanella colwelliana TaxID=23 RepID=UPI0022B00019|nr:DUF1778 domain-containing protein [Shewanella colwelliana]MCZ4337661.1 DUF1778 domain-containing protein [Shewanella colwelliana]